MWKIAKKQKCKCALTGEKLTRKNISVDHIIPISKGGLNVASNVQLVTLHANKVKNNMSNTELLEFCYQLIKCLDIDGGYSATAK